MEPTFHDGNWLLVHWGARRIKPGNIVVIEREDQPGIFYIKRVAEVRTSQGSSSSKIQNKSRCEEFFVTSDNPTGSDSRQWGWLTAEELIGKSISRIRK
jgi:phage repressor protein C with HTH and peptisase S24 domain